MLTAILVIPKPCVVFAMLTVSLSFKKTYRRLHACSFKSVISIRMGNNRKNHVMVYFTGLNVHVKQYGKCYRRLSAGTWYVQFLESQIQLRAHVVEYLLGRDQIVCEDRRGQSRSSFVSKTLMHTLTLLEGH